MASRKLGDVLVGHGFLDEPGRAAAVAHANTWGTPLGHSCIALGLLSPVTLWQALALQLGANAVQLDGREIAPDVLALMPAALALKHRCVPVETRGHGMLLLAVDGPRDPRALDELAFSTGRRIMLLIAPEDALERALERCYPGRTVNLGAGPGVNHLVSSYFDFDDKR